MCRSGNVYYYFRTKQDIAKGVADIFVAETQSMLTEISEAESEPRRRVLALNPPVVGIEPQPGRARLSESHWRCAISAPARQPPRAVPRKHSTC